MSTDQIDAEEAAFDAGFNETDVTPVEQGNTTEQPAVDEATVNGATPPEATKEEPLTRAEIQAIIDKNSALEAQLTKVHDKAFGKIGELQQRIEQQRNMAYGLSPKARERVAEEYPDLAEMLFGGTEDIPEAQQAPQIDVESIVASRVKEKEQAFSERLEKRLLSKDHRDWQQVVSEPEFGQWAATLPVDEQQKLGASWDADYLSEKLTEYKDHRKGQVESTAGKVSEKQKRLEAALQPKGVPRMTPGSEDDEEAAMLKAFSG